MANKGRFAERLAIELASGSSVRDAAAIVGCSERQAYRLSRSDRVQQRVNDLRGQLTAQAIGKLSASAGAAVDTLNCLLTEQNEPAIRMQSAKAILNLLPSITTHFELLQRIEKIESRQNGSTGADTPRPRIVREG